MSISKRIRVVAIILVGIALTLVLGVTVLRHALALPVTSCTVSNQSSSTLTRVVISGHRFSVAVPDLGPRQTRVVTLEPSSEEGTLSVSFWVEGRLYQHTEDVYFEAEGYEASITINPSLQIAASVAWRG